jgi:hypothetical protein
MFQLQIRFREAEVSRNYLRYKLPITSGRSSFATVPLDTRVLYLSRFRALMRYLVAGGTMATASHSTTLVAYFEGLRLFATAAVEKLGSVADAKTMLRDGLKLGYEGDCIVLRSGDRLVH